MALRKNQRRSDFHDVFVGAGIACEEALVLESVDDVDRSVGVGCAHGIGLGDLYADEKPLAALRGDLAALGLARDETMPETEDHFACVCEVMRYLIAGDDVEVANLTQQQKFFSAHVQSWAPALCEAIAAHPKARFYAALAGFTAAFISVETQGFDLMV